MVRLAIKEDGAEIQKIFEDAKDLFAKEKFFQWSGDYPSIIDFKNDLINNIVIVYELNKVVCGCATILLQPDKNYNVINGKWLNDNEYISIHRIATKKNYYNMGVATSLFKECERIALTKKINNIRIDTHKLNIHMRSLLNKLGYKECGVIELLEREDLQDKERIAYQKVLY